MPIKSLFILLFLWFLLGFNTYAQKYQASGDEKIAKKFFLLGDYYTALQEYEYLYALDSGNQDLWYPLAVCYVNTNINKAKSIPLFEKVIINKDYDIEALYLLGKALHLSSRFDDALYYYEKFKELIKNNDKNYIPVTRMIETCENAAELVKKPVNVSVENVGAKINSPFPDYSPFVNKNETLLFFTSKKPGNTGGMIDYDGYYTADIFYTESKYGVWLKPKKMTAIINTPMVEEIAGMSADINCIFIFADNLMTEAQTLVSFRKGKNFVELKPLGTNVSPTNANANAVCITPDKKTIIFSSFREGGSGGSDLYLSKILPSGQWGPAENLGKTINTQYDEDYPNLSPDGKSLYFASIGHNSMGGFDIFKSEWNTETNTFSEPQNMGYPVNTADDNTSISFTNSGRYAYVSDYRPEDSYGNLDIYRIVFNDIKPNKIALRAQLINADSVNVIQSYRKIIQKKIDSLNAIVEAQQSEPAIIEKDSAFIKLSMKKYKDKLITGPEISIKIFNANSQQLYGNYKPNSQNGTFVAILLPGKYNIEIQCENFLTYTETIDIKDREIPVKEIFRLFILSPK